MNADWKTNAILRSPGFRGGNGRRLDGFMAVPCNYNNVADFRVGKSERLTGPSDVAPAYTLIDESRLYVAFGRDAVTGQSIPMNWDIDYMQLNAVMDSVLHELSGEFYDVGVLPIFRPRFYTCLHFAVFPITAPWTVPLPNTAGFPIPWGSDPQTPFTQNLVAGSLTGFINPATLQMDNHLAEAYGIGWDFEYQACTMQPAPSGGCSLAAQMVWRGLGVNNFSYDHICGAIVGSPSPTWAIFRTDSLGTQSPAYTNSAKLLNFQTWRDSPWRNQTIYGLGIYPLTIYDMNRMRVMGCNIGRRGIASYATLFIDNVSVPPLGGCFVLNSYEHDSWARPLGPVPYSSGAIPNALSASVVEIDGNDYNRYLATSGLLQSATLYNQCPNDQIRLLQVDFPL